MASVEKSARVKSKVLYPISKHILIMSLLEMNVLLERSSNIFSSDSVSLIVMACLFFSIRCRMVMD